MSEPKCDIEQNPIEGPKECKEGVYTTLGKLFSLITQNGADQHTRPMGLYASAALLVLSKENDLQKTDIGDIDIATNAAGVLWLENLLKDRGQKLSMRDLRMESGKTPPLLGNPETMHLRCSIQVTDKKYDLDVWADLDDKGEMEGMSEKVSADRDIVQVPLSFKDNNEKREVVIPVFNSEALKKIYEHLDKKQLEHGTLPEKRRVQSIQHAYENGKIVINSPQVE